MDVKDCSAETLNVAVDFMYDISIPGNFKEIKGEVRRNFFIGSKFLSNPN